MELFGKIVEVFKIIFRTTDDTTADPSVHSQVTMEVNSSQTYNQDVTLQLPNTNQSDILVSRDSTDVLTNKTIDASSNPISGLEHGVHVDNPTSNVHGVTGSVVGTSDTQTLTQKTLDATPGTNTITNITTTSIDATTLVTEADTIAGNDSDTQIPTTAATRARVESHELDAADAHAASAITNTPAGGVAATTAQGAIDELDTDKLARDGSQPMTGSLNMGDTNSITDVASIELEDGATIDTETGSGQVDIGGTNATQVNIGRSGQDTVVRGNLTVQGTTTTVNTDTLDVEDPNITVNNGGSDATSEGAGLTVERTSTDGSLIYRDTSASKFAAGPVGSESDLVDTDGSQILQNKTIQGINGGGTNIITGLTDSSINPGANINASKLGTGDVSNTEFNQLNGVTSEIVQVDGAQTINGTKTMAGPILNNPAINGAGIDDAANPVTITANTSGLTLDGTVSGTMIKDEDNMVSDSDVHLATQQSIKTYVDNSVGGATGSGSGEINYITNPLFNANADGWYTIDTGGATPSDTLTAPTQPASNAFTITSSTDYIIEGNASGKITKVAAQSPFEDCICTEFTIPEGTRAQPQKLEFRWHTDALSQIKNPNWKVWLIQNSGGGSGTATEITPEFITNEDDFKSAKYRATWTPNSTNVANYRLVLQYNGSDTDAEEFYIDSVVVGPEQISSTPRETIRSAVIDGSVGYNTGQWWTYTSGAAVPTTYTSTNFADDSSINIVKVQSTTVSFSDTVEKRFIWNGNALGKGHATPLVISQAQANRLLTVEFDYRVNTVWNRSNTELDVIIISELDDSTYVLPNRLTVDSVGTYHFKDSVVLPGAGNYRLLLHINSATSAADNLDIGNLYVGTGAPGNIAQVPLATIEQPGIVKSPAYLTGQGNGIGFTVGALQAVNFSVQTANGITADGGTSGTTFTVQEAGLYNIDSSIMWSSGAAGTGDQLITFILVNGITQYRTIDYGRGITFQHTNVSKTLQLSAGDTINISASGSSNFSVYVGGGAGTYRQLSIYRITA